MDINYKSYRSGSLRSGSGRLKKHPVDVLKKATFYLSKDILDKLEQAWVAKREETLREDEPPPSKSSIVDRALEQYLRVSSK